MVTSFTLVWIKIIQIKRLQALGGVTSFTLVWIKIIVTGKLPEAGYVTSFTLVWIKIPEQKDWIEYLKSRASRSCGLK